MVNMVLLQDAFHVFLGFFWREPGGTGDDGLKGESDILTKLGLVLRDFSEALVQGGRQQFLVQRPEDEFPRVGTRGHRASGLL